MDKGKIENNSIIINRYFEYRMGIIRKDMAWDYLSYY